MKTINCKSFFKTINDKSSPVYGEKREDLNWSFNGYSGEDVLEADASTAEKLAVLVNSQMESYGRKLVLAKNDVWTFSPDGLITLDIVYNDLVRETTRKRKVTKETLALCGKFYADYAGQLLGKDTKASNAGDKVIALKLQPISGNREAVKVMKDNILKLIEAASEVTDDIKLSEDLFKQMDCLEWLIDECDSLLKTDEDLENSL
jgi:hypothetical protein